MPKQRKLLHDFVHRSNMYREKPLLLKREHLANGLLHAWEMIAREHSGRYGTKASAVYGYGAVLGAVEFAADSKIVSVGSGNGVFETFLAKHVCPKGELVGIDFSPGMNSIAQSFARRENVSNARFVHAASENLPLQSHSQDVVLSIDMLHFSSDWRKSVSEFARVVAKKPNSKVIVMFKLEGSVQQISDIAVKEALVANGLEIVNARQLEFKDKIDKEHAVVLARAGFWGAEARTISPNLLPRFVSTKEAFLIAKPRLN